MNKPQFKIYKDVKGNYRWRLVAKNGEIVATSEGYTTKQNAINSAYRIKEIAWDAEVLDYTNCMM